MLFRSVALDPTVVETRRAAVDVETTGRLTTGATIVDWRGQWGRLANTEVAVAVDAERFQRLFFDAIARLAEGAGGSWERVASRKVICEGREPPSEHRERLECLSEPGACVFAYGRSIFVPALLFAHRGAAPP